MNIKDFPEPVDGYSHRYVWNCGLINQMMWWPTLSRYEKNRLNELLAWNAKFLDLQAANCGGQYAETR